MKTLGRGIYFKTVGIISILWAVYYAFVVSGTSVYPYCTSNINPFYTILTGSFLHGNLSHLVGNSISLLLMVPLVLCLYKKDFWIITGLGLFGSGIYAYTLPNYTLGISGLVYTYLAYLILRGIGSKDRARFLTAVVLVLISGSLIFAMTPLARDGIAWYSHLGGAISAFFYSLYRYLK